MARMHTRRHGKSGSKRPLRDKNPSWVPLDAAEVTSKAVELARRGETLPRIGTILRDEHGVPSVRLATGKRLEVLLTDEGAAPKLPEDMRALIRRAMRLQDHLATNPKDLHNGRSLHLIEAKIRRLVHYYQSREDTRLPPDYSYKLEEARLLVE